MFPRFMDLVPAPISEALRVLLVDDDTTLCESLSHLLKMDGLAVTAAHDGSFCLSEARIVSACLMVCKTRARKLGAISETTLIR